MLALPMSGEAAYLIAVAIGVTLAALASRLAPSSPDSVPLELRARVRRAALVGGVGGAYLFELPADLFGWSAPSAAGLVPLGGRTVLGGILGGWLAVEYVKHRAAFRGATGDRFALPLAIALAAGRVGCTLRGCCEGVRIDATSPLARVSLALHGEARFPAALVEGWFHGLAAIALVAATARDAAPGARLAIYLAVYAVVRFALERARDHPSIALGLTYYQLLAIALFALAAITAARRLRARSRVGL